MPVFDVRNVRPGSIADSLASRSINLMCAVLKGITYLDLYERPFHYIPGAGKPNNPGPPPHPFPPDLSDPSLSPLDRMIGNVYHLPDKFQKGASNDNLIVIDRLIGPNGALLKIKNDLVSKNYPEIQLKRLFYEKANTIGEGDVRAAYVNIVTFLEELHSYDQADPLKDQMYHFCASFLTYQKDRVPADGTLARPKTAPTANDLNRFLDRDHFGNLELQHLHDIFTYRYDVFRPEAKHALDCCILKEYRPADTKPPEPIVADVSGGGNKMYCQGPGAGCGSCGHPDDWCSDYVQGGVTYCTLSSDYH